MHFRVKLASARARLRGLPGVVCPCSPTESTPQGWTRSRRTSARAASASELLAPARPSSRRRQWSRASLPPAPRPSPSRARSLAQRGRRRAAKRRKRSVASACRGWAAPRRRASSGASGSTRRPRRCRRTHCSARCWPTRGRTLRACAPRRTRPGPRRCCGPARRRRRCEAQAISAISPALPSSSFAIASPAAGGGASAAQARAHLPCAVRSTHCRAFEGWAGGPTMRALQHACARLVDSARDFDASHRRRQSQMSALARRRSLRCTSRSSPRSSPQPT